MRIALKSTMKKLSGILITFSLLVLPMYSFAAQVGDIDPNANSYVTCAMISSGLHYGSHDGGGSIDVYMLQDFLNTNGYLTSNPNGFFGKATLKAVEAFQSAVGLLPTGYVGPLTTAKIQAIDCAGGDAATSTVDMTTNAVSKNTLQNITQDPSQMNAQTPVQKSPLSSIQHAINPFTGANTLPLPPSSFITPPSSSATATSTNSQFVIPFFLNKTQ